VPGDDRRHLCVAGIEVELMNVVQHVDGGAGRAQHRRLGNGAGPITAVVVPAHGRDGCNLAEGGENVGRPDVARMNDMVDAVQALQDLRP
jgi:hypothetical protein